MFFIIVSLVINYEKNSLEELQKRLKFNIVQYNLEEMWQAHPIINDLRKRIVNFLPKNKLYDPQDLEHLGFI